MQSHASPTWVPGGFLAQRCRNEFTCEFQLRVCVRVQPTHRLDHFPQPTLVRQSAHVDEDGWTLSVGCRLLPRELGEEREVLNNHGLARGETLRNLGCGGYERVEENVPDPLSEGRTAGEKQSRGSRRPLSPEDLTGNVLVNVVYDVQPQELRDESDRYQLRIVKVHESRAGRAVADGPEKPSCPGRSRFRQRSEIDDVEIIAFGCTQAISYHQPHPAWKGGGEGTAFLDGDADVGLAGAPW